MLELFVIGTFWFWALIIAEIVLLFLFVEKENGVGATVSMVIFLCALQWMGDVDILGFVFSNPLKLAAIVASYFAFGAVWGTVKWWIFCRDRKEDYNNMKDAFLREKGVAPGTKVVPEEHRQAWQTALRNEANNAYRRQNDSWTLAEAPRVRDNKAKIMRTMSWWPISMIWSFLDDFIKRVFRTIYYKISGVLQRIADKMFGDVQDDLAGVEPEDEDTRRRRRRNR